MTAVHLQTTIFIGILRKSKFANPEGEWFKCTLNDLRNAIWEIKTGEQTEENRVLSFGMRPEQEEAVNKTIAYFKSFKKENPKTNPTLFMEC